MQRPGGRSEHSLGHKQGVCGGAAGKARGAGKRLDLSQAGE